MTEGAQLGCESTILLLGVGRTRWFSMLTVTFWKQLELSKHLNSRCSVECDLSIPSKGSVEPAYGRSGPGNATVGGTKSNMFRRANAFNSDLSGWNVAV